MVKIKIYQNLQETYLKKEDKLSWCKLVSANLIFDGDIEHYKMHYILNTESGVVSIDESEIHLYNKNGIEWQKSMDTLVSLPEHVYPMKVNDTGQITYEVIVFDGVTPIKETIIPIAATFSYGSERRWVLTWNKIYNFVKECYKSEVECSDWNRCKVKEENGNEHWQEGMFYGLLLNDEQKQAVTRFEESCEELKRAGVSIILDAYGTGSYAVPSDNVIYSDEENPENSGSDGEWENFAPNRLLSLLSLTGLFKSAKGYEDQDFWLKTAE